MFRDIKEMTTEELEKELYAIKLYEIEISKVSVEVMTNKDVDLSFLKEMQCTITPNGELFRTDKKGFLPQMMDDLYSDRKKVKSQMIKYEQEYEMETDPEKREVLKKQIASLNNLQLSKKLTLNSAYGILGSVYFRFFDLRLATAVTSGGRLAFFWIEKAINEYMNKTLSTSGVDYLVAGDTDSVYIRLSELVEKVFKNPDENTNKVIDFMDKVCSGKLQDLITNSYNDLAKYVNSKDQKMRMKREALCNRGLWTAKKNYILNVYDNEGVRYAEPKLKIKGLHVVKSSTPAALKPIMKKVINLLFNGTEAEVQKYIANYKKEFFKMEAEVIASPRGVNNVARYTEQMKSGGDKPQLHVRGSIVYNQHLKKKGLLDSYPLIQEGDKIKYIYLKLPNPVRENVVSFPGKLPSEFGLSKYIDYEVQFDKTFVSPIKIILDCVNWQTKKVNSLGAFLN